MTKTHGNKEPTRNLLIRRCYHCEKTVDIQQEYYTIVHEPAMINVAEGRKKPKLFFFHVDCFKGIAGDEYV